ncbi:MAG: hypothetical protein C0617_02780 [Desulfuromonas sp.]|uniref:hypothetical protein n=1 Tax=Desulfuromonas sp. TaxID=892 RepID=UPI000CAE082D|nr:hypothetical protein [Desulfuromonas sp.]PLX85912.1 MAG: hypothetical protein C0617_02780 [Desulfuromonas sp.]
MKWLVLLVILGFFAVAGPAQAGERRLSLLQKDPASWQAVSGGARGRLIFDEAEGGFVLNAHRLLPATDYALVRYAGRPPWGHILARGVSDGQGRLRLSGFWAEWSKKIWLVLGADVAGHAGDSGPAGLDRLKGWNPRAYLFEEEGL